MVVHMSFCDGVKKLIVKSYAIRKRKFLELQNDYSVLQEDRDHLLKILKEKDQSLKELEKMRKNLIELSKSRHRHLYSFSDTIYAHGENNEDIYMLLRDDRLDPSGKIIVKLCLFSTVRGTSSCRSQIELDPKDRTIELLSIDTEDNDMRKGLASFMLKWMKSYCKSNGYKKLYGALHLTTPIGMESLRKFYGSNGFDIKECTFEVTF
jgi:GNAT superfamily N-acetyltransferase